MREYEREKRREKRKFEVSEARGKEADRLQGQDEATLLHRSSQTRDVDGNRALVSDPIR